MPSEKQQAGHDNGLQSLQTDQVLSKSNSKQWGSVSHIHVYEFKGTSVLETSQSPHAANRWTAFGQSYTPGPGQEHTGWNTHIALVAGVQVWPCGSFASEDICSLLNLEAAITQGFVQLPHL